MDAVWTYPERFIVSYSTNFGNGFGNDRRICGDKGLLKLGNWNHPVYTAEGAARRDGSIRGENKVAHPPGQPDHWLNWLECVAAGDRRTIAPIEAGLQHAVATIMATRSFETGRRTTWDPERRRII